MAEVRETISIGSKADTRGFKKAEAASEKLRKSFRNLAGAIGVTLSTRAIINFGKASVKAFSEAEKSNIQLANSVKNLGLSFAQSNITNFLDKISASSGIAGETLNAAFQALLNTSGSLTKSQELLTLALDVSAGSSKDLVTVSQDLANAYVGNTKGLKKYNLGLTATQLKLASFTDLQARLNKQYSGANASYLNTYAGKMQILGEAAGNAQEIIGAGLVDALGMLAGDGVDNINAASEAMAGLATETSNVIRGQARVLQNLASLGGGTGGKIAGYIKGYFKEVLGIQALEDLGRATQPRARANRRFAGGAQANLYDASVAAEKKFQKQQKKFQDQQLKVQKALTAEQKKQASLKKSATVFDQEQIQLIAALKGKLSEEDRKRVEAQLALLNNNDALAQKLTREILMAQDATGGLYRYFLTIGDAKIKNPFAFLDEWLIQFQDKLKKTFDAGTPSVYKPPAGAFMDAPANVSADKALEIADNNLKFALDLAAANDKLMADIANSNAVKASNDLINQIFPVTVSQPTGNFTYGQGNPMATNVYVTVQGSVTTEEDLVRKIASGLQNQSLSTGDSSYINRRTGGFAG